MDKASSDSASTAYEEGVDAFLEFAQSKNPNSDVSSDSNSTDSDYENDPLFGSDNETDLVLQKVLTGKSKANQGKTVVTYNKRGVPVGEGAKKLSTFEGCVARSIVPITYESWLDVDKETKEACWQNVLARFVLDPKSRKHTLQSIGTKWKNFKHYLYKNFIAERKDLPEEELLTPPAMYPHVTKEDWKLFVEQRTSKKWEDKSIKAKSIRAKHKYNHRLSRKGYAGLIAEIMEETGKTEEEIDRVECWKKARELKQGGFDPNVQKIVDKIDELQKEESSVQDPCGTHDVLTQALGTEEQRGHVRGMGKFVKPPQYFIFPKTIKQYLDNANKRMNRRFEALEDEIKKLKRGNINNNVSEGASCQTGSDEIVEDKAAEEPLDNSCFLAVDVISNIVAKGTVVNYSLSGENVEVKMDTCVQGEALLPIPPEEDFLEKVKDALGCILSWPRHLVIRCCDLNKMPAKNAKKDVERNTKTIMGKEKETGKKLESKKEKKRPREPDEENKKELITGKKDDEKCGSQFNTDDAINEKKAKKTKMNEKEPMQKRMTRGQRKTRIRMEKSVALKMVAIMVDGQVSKVDSIKVQCDDDLFGYESYTYLNWNDFDKVFSMDELSGAVVASYTMYLHEQIKNGPKRDHGICFMTPSATMQSERKATAKNIDDSSRIIADRLSTRKDNHIILLPYNPGRHWVLGVLDMKTSTCYYLDSLRTLYVNPQFRKIVDAAISLYDVQSRSKKMTKLNWVNSKCPRQSGSTECGYYVLKFMKEIVGQGVQVLVNNNIGGSKNEYTDADFDEIREEWSTYVANFIFPNS